jgi:hypothetical protein
MIIAGDPRYVPDPRFTNKMREALKLLSSKSPMPYVYLTETVGRIRAWDRSGSDVTASPPTINIAARTFNASLTWLASVLAHESGHALLRLTNRPYTGLEAERICNAHQLMALREMGAPQSEIAYMLSLTGDHFDLNHDGKYDESDYQLRDY